MQSLKQTVKGVINFNDFSHYYQPIYNIDNWEQIGWESLLRTTSTTDIKTILSHARSANELYELEKWSVHNSINTYNEIGFTVEEGKLFINLFAVTLLNDTFLVFLEKVKTYHSLQNELIVFEISKLEEIYDLEKFIETLKKIRAAGFLIALDDIRTSYLHWIVIEEASPEYLKLNQYFSKNLHRSRNKQLVIDYFMKSSEKNRYKLILKGVEKTIELLAAKALGVHYCQGFLLGAPRLLQTNSVMDVERENEILKT